MRRAITAAKAILAVPDGAATIGEVLSVPLARPRDRLALAHDPVFIDCRSAVLEFLYQKQKKAAA